ncbi:nucleotide exchange factor GrpE [Aquisalimonas sp. 2447]|uniref:nucleotide exchange factor GrpE n=1 Tax=Aquisalimonas sp. 2447 TaxID=2740807 RepID=UPI0014324257|nr:nucleotide exchange factor GrpE [Aquisalimonas sp. 2447]QIT55222.1 nucleotide exchange factor GrpE [Aquisalimonas sp. 2447]
MADKDQDTRTDEAESNEQQPVEGTLDDNTADESSGSEESDRVQELEEKLREAEEKAEENWNQFLRARAEMENARRRLQKDVEQAKRQGLEKLAGELLPVKDSLEMGLAAAQEANADVAKLSEGTELTLKMLAQALEKFEVEEIEPMGKKFDPERHEAMATQPSAEHEPNTVIHVVQKGYMLNDRLLRPAMVIVSKEAEQQQGGHIDEQA